MKKKSFLKIFLGCWMVFMLTLAVRSASFAAEGFPNREIELVVSYTAGGMTDLAVRIITEEFSKNLGVPIVVVNKPGGAATEGAVYVTQAKHDGHTILATTIGLFVLLPAMQPNIPFKASDFIPVARYAIVPNLLLVRKDAPWKTLEELITYAKKNPGKLTCGSGGVASVSHFNLELLKVEAGVDIQHVPFKGGSPMNPALLGGHIDLSFNAVSTVHGLLKSGDLRALASGAGKVAEFPEIPTLAEKGYPKATLALWTGLFVPKGVEKSVVNKITSALEKTLKVRDVTRKLEEIGNQIDYVAGEKFAQELEEDSKKMSEVVKKANLIVK
ncbi:MAG: tripartite tricarboxylate transporter substrate binding protein [Deltaproteobacteria bacterium]